MDKHLAKNKEEHLRPDLKAAVQLGDFVEQAIAKGIEVVGLEPPLLPEPEEGAAAVLAEKVWYKKELPEEERLVKQISVRKSGTDLYYTLDEISELCGVNKSTVSRWVRKGEFPARRVGQFINIPRLEFDAWYEKYKQKQKRRK